MTRTCHCLCLLLWMVWKSEAPVDFTLVFTSLYIDTVSTIPAWWCRLSLRTEKMKEKALQEKSETGSLGIKIGQHGDSCKIKLIKDIVDICRYRDFTWFHHQTWLQKTTNDWTTKAVRTRICFWMWSDAVRDHSLSDQFCWWNSPLLNLPGCVFVGRIPHVRSKRT